MQKLKVSEIKYHSSRRSWWPRLTASYEYGWAGVSPTALREGWDVSIGLQMPVWSWGEISANIHQAQLRRDQIRNEVLVKTQKLSTSLIRARELAEAHLNDERRLSGMVDDMRQTAFASVKRYRRGAMRIIEVTDALEIWSQSLLKERHAHYAFLDDLAEMERLEGKSLVKYDR